MFGAAPMSLFPNADLGNEPEVIGADIPAGGKTSARAIAKMYAALCSLRSTAFGSSASKG